MSPTVPFTDSRWTTRNTPTRPTDMHPDGSSISILSNDGTDWWRVPGRDSSDGIVYGFKQPISKDGGIEISVKLDIEYTNQAALFLQLGPSTWVKAGLEYDGELTAGVVCTFPWSDWSIQKTTPHPPRRIKMVLVSDSLKVYFDDLMVREVNVFGQDETEAFVGVMTCSPKGGGAKATFTDFQLREGAWANKGA